jgi:hypothetical protein
LPFATRPLQTRAGKQKTRPRSAAGFGKSDSGYLVLEFHPLADVRTTERIIQRTAFAAARWSAIAGCDMAKFRDMARRNCLMS